MALAAASEAGSLNITTMPAGVSPPPPPANPAAAPTELVIDSGGDYTIPAGSAGAPDYVVIVDSIAAVKSTGAPNSSTWAVSVDTTIIDPATITISEGYAGNVSTTVTGRGNQVAGNDTMI